MNAIRLSILSLLLLAAPGLQAQTTTHATASRATTTRPATTQPGTRPRLALNQKAPDLAVTDLDGKPLKPDAFRGAPLILQFGSLTEPVFRLHAPDSEKLAKDYAGKAAFAVIYQKESHPADSAAALEVNDGFALAAPATFEERLKLAKLAVERLGLKHQKMLVDAWADTTALRYGGLPNMTFLLDARGNLAAAYPWMDAKKLRAALDLVLAGKTVPPEFQGQVRRGEIPPADLDALADGRLAIAVALDRLKLTDKQKEAIYPALAQVVADLRELREARTAKDGTPEKTPEEFRAGVAKVQSAVAKLRQILKDNLSEADAKTTLDALTRSIPPRLLGDRK